LYISQQHEENAMKRITMTLAVAAIFIISARGQGFLNLNFESAQNLPGNPPEDGVSVAVTNALPDWTAYFDSAALADIYYVSNYFPGGSSSSVELEGGSLAISGDFSVELFSDGSISQTGLVPDNAESLQFEVHGPGPGGSIGPGFSVTLGGQSLSYSAVSAGPDYIVYGASIPANLDGQTEALSFLCVGPGSGLDVLDNIQFSTLPIPEPGELALAVTGAVLFGFARSKKRTP
jgi:hypothetical protein